ncbi:MAG: hypothetical protein KDD69_14780, partial [Bdellovibrionales bacterium]|nr:hypothetical protein [Bdellovibrionales bacterium]
MVSSLPFFSVKHVKLSGGNAGVKIVALAALVALAWKYSGIVVLIGSTGYAMSGPVGFLWSRYFPSSWERQRSFLGLSSQ